MGSRVHPDHYMPTVVLNNASNSIWSRHKLHAMNTSMLTARACMHAIHSKFSCINIWRYFFFFFILFSLQASAAATHHKITHAFTYKAPHLWKQQGKTLHNNPLTLLWLLIDRIQEKTRVLSKEALTNHWSSKMRCKQSPFCLNYWKNVLNRPRALAALTMFNGTQLKKKGHMVSVLAQVTAIDLKSISSQRAISFIPNLHINPDLGWDSFRQNNQELPFQPSQESDSRNEKKNKKNLFSAKIFFLHQCAKQINWWEIVACNSSKGQGTSKVLRGGRVQRFERHQNR